MSMAEFIRVMDLGWEDFLWGSLWATLVIVLFNTLVLMTIIPAIYEWLVKFVMPKWYNGRLSKLVAENKRLKGELVTALNDRQNFKDRLLAVKNSAEVRGI